MGLSASAQLVWAIKQMKRLKAASSTPGLLLSLRGWVYAAAVALAVSGCPRRDTVEPTVDIDSPPETWVRVLLFGNLSEYAVSTPAGFTVEALAGGVTADFSETGSVHIRLQDGRIYVGRHRIGPAVVLRPKEPYYFELEEMGFRGHLYLHVNAGNDGIQAVNHVPLESYLLGVVGAEMYSYWEPEALKAQAVAARTYSLAIGHRFGRGRHWDMTRTQANQVYKGLEAENSRIRQAVLDTAGQLLIAPGRDGREVIFPTYYSSSCGGHTENSRRVFGPDWVNLPGVRCSWCEQTARRGDFYWGPQAYSMAEVSQRLMRRYASLASLERIEAIEIRQTGYEQRITQVGLTGVNGRQDHVRGEDFRLTLDPTGRRLRSTLVELSQTNETVRFTDGRGFGHGVGLCQYGAQGLARDGRTWAEVLAFYYPEARLVRIETVMVE